MIIECPECSGEGGHKDYFGEWSECDCCSPWNKPNETGRCWIWTWWLYRFKNWRIDRMIMREMKREDQ